MREPDTALRWPRTALTMLPVRDQVVHDLGRAQHPRQASPGMCAGAHKVEIRQILGAIVGSEIRRLGQDRLDREGRAQVAVERTPEMARIDHVLADSAGRHHDPDLALLGQLGEQ